MGQPAKVDVEAPVPELKPTLRTTRDTVGLRDALLARKAKKLQATRLGFLFLYMTILFGVWILALRHNRISLYELEFEPRKPLGVVLKGCDLVVKRGSEAKVRLKTHLSSAASSTVHKSNCRGALLNHDLRAVDATPARRRGGAGSSLLDGASTAAPSPRSALDALVDFHTGRRASRCAAASSSGSRRRIPCPEAATRRPV